MNVFSNEYVDKFILYLDLTTQAKVQHSFDLLEKYGNLLGMPHVRRIHSPLFELRIRGKQEVRIIFVFWKNSCYLLHGFVKKTQKTPHKEIASALKRLSYLK